MEYLFARMLDEVGPKVNDRVMEGLASSHMKQVESYLDQVFRSVSESFPTGLKYEGFQRCTPLEEYTELTKVKNNKRVFDLAKSDLYLIRYAFSFNGERIRDRYIHALFDDGAGIFSLSGSKFHITPVLSDKVISPGVDTVFVRLLRDKIIFRRLYHSIVIDDKRETTHVVWSQIYRKQVDAKNPPISTKAVTSIAHYLFAKYGFTETFKKFCGFVPVVGEEDINPITYPPDKWIICESSQVKPKTFIGEFYRPTNLRLAIPRCKWDSMCKSLVIGFYYVVDHFPNRFKANYLDSTSLWMILLGHIIFSGVYGENKLYENINEHFISLNEYVDTIVKDKLKESGYEINDFYGLLGMIIGNFNNFILDKENTVSSVYGKSLEVLYYVLFNITSNLFIVNFKLNKIVAKNRSNGKIELSMKDVIETFNKNMKPGAIFSLASGKIITETVSYSGDHKYPKITSKITEQESLPGATRGSKKRPTRGPSYHLDISVAMAGSVLYLSKASVAPIERVNPFITIDHVTGKIIPNERLEAINKDVREKLEAINKSNITHDEELDVEELDGESDL